MTYQQTSHNKQTPKQPPYKNYTPIEEQVRAQVSWTTNSELKTTMGGSQRNTVTLKLVKILIYCWLIQRIDFLSHFVKVQEFHSNLPKNHFYANKYYSHSLLSRLLKNPKTPSHFGYPSNGPNHDIPYHRKTSPRLQPIT